MVTSVKKENSSMFSVHLLYTKINVDREQQKARNKSRLNIMRDCIAKVIHPITGKKLKIF
jgi:hypothetical protein